MKESAEPTFRTKDRQERGTGSGKARVSLGPALGTEGELNRAQIIHPGKLPFLALVTRANQLIRYFLTHYGT